MLRIESRGGHVEDHNSRFHVGGSVNHGCDDLLENAASTPKPEKRHCRNYKETKHGTEVLDKTSGSRSERFGTRIHHRSRAVKPIRN